MKDLSKKSDYELLDILAVMLGISGDESQEVRHSDINFKKRVLRKCIVELNNCWERNDEYS